MKNKDWAISPTIRGVHQLSVSCVLNSHVFRDIDDAKDFVYSDICQNLASSILKNNLICIRTNKDIFSDNITYIGTINITEPNKSSAIVEDDCFVTGTEKFTIDELDVAVKSYYAERFI